jgi:putative restriction endonuclease
MSITQLLKDPGWDAPFFKRLAHNDTGRAVGHQAGMVLPKDLRIYLPSLDEGETSMDAPTTERYLRAELFLNSTHLADSAVRYQFQTWGGTRSPESRITDGFGPLRDRARSGDLIVFQRRADSLSYLRMLLVPQGSPDFAEVDAMTEGKRWGALIRSSLPVSEADVEKAKAQVAQLAAEPFQLTQERPRVETKQMRLARSAVFGAQVRKQYGGKCCVTGIAIATPTRLFEVESAHIVPVSEGGSDDIRNGLSLTQSVHWAFDRGLFGIRPDRTIYVPRRVKQMSENEFLRNFEGRSIAEASSPEFRVHAKALQWHFDRRVAQWE